MSYQYYWGVLPFDLRVAQELFDQRLPEGVDVEWTIGPFGPVGIVAKAVDTHALEVGVFGEPFLGPEVLRVLRETPSRGGASPESVYENKVGDDC